MSQQEALTSWGGQMSGLVRIWKESEQARGTYILERAEVKIGQNTERK